MNGFEDKIDCFCVCYFMKLLFVIREMRDYQCNCKSKCLNYNSNQNKFNYKANMNQYRIGIACTVF